MAILTKNGPVIAGLALALALGTASAHAQSAPTFYYGLGAGFTSLESTVPSFGGDSSEGQFPTLSAVFGAEWQNGGAFYGAEGDIDLGFDGETESAGIPCSTVASAPYLCEFGGTVRARGIYGADVGGIKVFGALGIGGVFGQFADNSNSMGSGSVYGLTAGAGAYFPVSSSMTVRGEVIYDDFDQATQSGGYESEYSGVSARVLAMFSF